MPHDIGAHQIQKILDGFGNLEPHLEEMARERGAELLDEHRRVRTAAQMKGISYRIEPKLPPDILGIYVFLPAGAQQ